MRLRDPNESYFDSIIIEMKIVLKENGERKYKERTPPIILSHDFVAILQRDLQCRIGNTNGHIFSF